MKLRITTNCLQQPINTVIEVDDDKVDAMLATGKYDRIPVTKKPTTKPSEMAKKEDIDDGDGEFE